MGIFDVFAKALNIGNRTFNPKYAESKDFLEAVCAAAARVAAADGEISNEEEKHTHDLILNHKVLGALYSKTEIENTVNTMLSKAHTFSGKLQLKREVEDVATKPKQMREDVFIIAYDVANADGNVGDEEQKVLDKLAKELSIDINSMV